jgi:hypothetical protein
MCLRETLVATSREHERACLLACCRKAICPIRSGVLVGRSLVVFGDISPDTFHASAAFLRSLLRKDLQDHFLPADALSPSSVCRRLDFPSSDFSDTLPSSTYSLLRHNLRNCRVLRVWYTKIHHSEGWDSLGVLRGL